MAANVVMIVIILLILGALYALFHFGAKPPKEKIDQYTLPSNGKPVDISKEPPPEAWPVNSRWFSRCSRAEPIDISELVKKHAADDSEVLGHIDWAKGPDMTANAAPRACFIDEETYDVITKNVPGFSGVVYPKPIFLSYYRDEELSQPPWLRYRDTKGHFIKKDLAMDLFNLRTALAPYVQYQERAFMVDYRIYRVTDRQ